MKILYRRVLFLLLTQLSWSAHAATFLVNDSGLGVDVNPGNGVCEVAAGSGDCSLMAAINEANAQGGAHTINFDASVAFILGFASYDLSGADITIQGAGRSSIAITANDFGTLQNDVISGVTIVHGLGVTILDDNVSLSDNMISFLGGGTGQSTITKNTNGSAVIDTSELVGSLSNSAMINLTDGGTLTVSNSTLRDNNNTYGVSVPGGPISSGAIVITSADTFTATLNINNCRFLNNSGYSTGVIDARAYAGVINMTITDSVFIGNNSGGDFFSGYGAIAWESPGDLSISGSVFSGNEGTYALYGALAITLTGDGTAVISNSSFTENTALVTSAINVLSINAGDRALTLTNVTVSDNQTTGNLNRRPAVFLEHGIGVLTANIVNSTITNNAAIGADNGGGLELSGDIDLTLKNSIIANNTNTTGITDCGFAGLGGFTGTLTSEGYNIIGSNDICAFTATSGDQFGTNANPIDPMLAAMTVDTATGLSMRAPLPGSPAIDNGENSGICTDISGATLSTDMLGNPRPADGDSDLVVACDIGAVEIQPDITPDAFTFSDQLDVAVSTQITSNLITVTGIDAAAAISITNGEYRINAGVFTAVAGVVSNADTVEVRHTSAAANATATDTVLTIGGVSDTFTSTTIAATTIPADVAAGGGGGSSMSLISLLLSAFSMVFFRRKFCNASRRITNP